MKRKLLLMALVLICVTMILPAQTIKIGSLAPVGTPWDDALREIAREWSEITRGRVKLKIYPGGIAGDEDQAIRKVKLGQLQGVVLTTVGMNKIHDDLFTIALPMLLQTEEEVQYIIDKMGPKWEGILQERGFELVAWQIAGWINFFSTEFAADPDEYQALKMRMFPGEPEMEQVFKSLGFRLVPLPQTEVLQGLQTGMIEAFYSPPVLAAAQQWFALAPHMNTLKISPLVGSMVVGKRFWDRIPEQYHDELKRSAAEIIAPLNSQVLEAEEKAMEIMLRNGLQVHEASDEELGVWMELAREALDSLAGSAYSREIYQEVVGHLDDYRRMNGGR